MKIHFTKKIIPFALLLIALLIVGPGCYEDPPNAEYYYSPDIDRDGFGDASATQVLYTEADAPANYVKDNSDCNDAEASINPDATEIPDNLVDEDCNGKLSFTFYYDNDDDGFGTPDTTEIIEIDSYDDDAPQGFSWVAGDCNDNDDNINPLAREIQDDVDNDCDGTIDVIEWYTDEDGDGYGSQHPTAAQGVTNNLDCDDDNAEIHPYRKETLNDGIDNDCDGDIK